MRYKIKDIPSEGMLVQLDLPRTLFADALEGMDADLDATTGNVRVELSKDRDDNVFAHGDLKALVDRAVRQVPRSGARQGERAAQDDLRRRERRARTRATIRSTTSTSRSTTAKRSISRRSSASSSSSACRCRRAAAKIARACAPPAARTRTSATAATSRRRSKIPDSPCSRISRSSEAPGNDRERQDHGCSEAKKIEGDA